MTERTDSLAYHFRENGIVVGDVVELISATHWFTKAVAEAMGTEENQPAEGLLVGAVSSEPSVRHINQ